MAECPYCDYEGESASVEAHVSGMSDEAHQGKSGAECRDEIGGCGDGSEEPEEEATPSDQEPQMAPDSESEIGPGKSLVAGTVVVAVAILVKTLVGQSDGGEEPADQAEEGGEGLGEWSS